MPSPELVSVIMPAYQAQATLAESLDSLIAQTYQAWELLLIVDRKSRDETSRIATFYAAKENRIRLIENLPHGGCAYNRNEGIRQAQGEYIAFLDSDDLWLPEKLEKQVALMNRTGASLGYTGYAQMNWKGDRLPQTIIPPNQLTYQDLLSDNQLGCLTAIVRRTSFPALRFVDHLHEDLILWLELLRKTTAHGLSEPLAIYRQSPNSRSGNKAKAALARWRILRRYEKLPMPRAILYFLRYARTALRKRHITQIIGGE
jgi:teichuronic acid biosynthesis glycosyltransferase TuaG